MIYAPDQWTGSIGVDIDAASFAFFPFCRAPTSHDAVAHSCLELTRAHPPHIIFVLIVVLQHVMAISRAVAVAAAAAMRSAAIAALGAGRSRTAGGGGIARAASTAASSSALRLRLRARCPSCSSELSPLCTRRLFSSAASRRGPAASTSPPASSSLSSSSSSSSTTQTFHTRNGRVRIDLAKPSLVGVHQSRGERAYQEDTYAVRAVLLDGQEAARSVAELDGSPSPPSASPSPSASASSSSPGQRENGPASGAGSETATAPETEQAVYVGAFDGHNGTYVSAFLRDRLHDLVVGYGMHERGRIQRTVDAYRALGGYLRRYRPPALRGLIEDPVPRSRLAQLRQERDRSAKVKEREKADGKERSVGQQGGKGAAAERQAKAKEREKEKEKERDVGSDVGKSGSSTGKSPAVASGSSLQGGNSRSASTGTSTSTKESTQQYTLQQRITASFLEADLDIIGVDKECVPVPFPARYLLCAAPRPASCSAAVANGIS